jgi:formamidopyrimidine-DNA glycosylase
MRTRMPELPEVETVRRGLEPVMCGARFLGVEQRRSDLRFPLPGGFARRLEGTTCRQLSRRAKYLLARLSSGEVLAMHLGMSGRFTVSPAPLRRHVRGGGRAIVGEFIHDTCNDPAHDHVVFHLSSGVSVTYNDPRRFGYMELISEAELESHKLFRGLGAEPLSNSLNAGYLAQLARGRTADLKAFLLDQRIVAGLGNIYVCEALHRAGLLPHRSAACLAKAGGRPTERCERLVPQIRAVLEEAIAAGGSTLRNYARADGSLGDFQHSFRIYGREGEPCLTPGCRGIVRRSVQGGRSTFYCPGCQR